jgi:hypothetical protein
MVKKTKTCITMNPATAIRRRVLTQMASGVVVASIPVTAWWYWAYSEREKQAEAVRTAVRLPGGSQDTYDFLITEKCKPGDVVLFDRRCERCAAGPWSSLSCLASRSLLTNISAIGSIETGRFDHVGLIVPGYIRSRADKYDPTNLLLLESTPSGIVARPLKERLERSASRSVLLLQLNCPGQRRNTADQDDDQQLESVQRTRLYVERELAKFRDVWVALGEDKSYKRIHSTLGLGGALAYSLGLQEFVSGPTSPSAYLVLMGLHKAAVAQNISEKENKQIKVEDFLRNQRFDEKNSVRLRPGWRFLAPIALKENSRS